MTKGYVETSVTKCLILGAAGVGKTHLRHLLLKKDPPEQRVSTGLADNPVRAISFSRANVGEQEEDEWFVAEDDQALIRFIGGTIKDCVTIATSLDDVISTLPKIAAHVILRVRSGVADGRHATPIDTTQPSSTVSSTVTFEDELIHHINQSSGKGWLKTVYIY